ncbi:MAG: DNA phosphorothioation-associated putative methyltransferase, partial [Gammaproteobacteria bacterium]|nr:DNA phosphorothioation-associated putative methyltransferase [Gammaproteobacteria bacterium]
AFDNEIVTAVCTAEKLANVRRCDQFNVVRFNGRRQSVSLLNYPQFIEEPFPALVESWLINLASETASYRSYSSSQNPPIFHRKELLLGPHHPRYEEFDTLTSNAEALGLFDKPKGIGYQVQWNKLIKDSGFRVEGHSLLPIGNLESKDDKCVDNWPGDSKNDDISRHLTALNRSSLSAPIQTLGRYGYLNKQLQLFDYGCGYSSDVTALRSEGINAHGWDPYYAPDNKKHKSDIVNLGFVVNVIEDSEERVEALKNAWSLATQLLVVSVMLENLNRGSGKKFKDGFISARNTFQKYYSQIEIIAFVREVLDIEPVAVAPGIIYAFKDKDLEQDFRLKRYSRIRYRSSLKSLRVSLAPRATQKEKMQRFFDANRELLSELWVLWLELGRRPLDGEVKNLSATIDLFGTLKKGLNFLEKLNGSDEIDNSFKARLADLKVYFALGIFEQRSLYKVVSPKIRNDIKFFFGSIRNAKEDAADLLYKIADRDLIEEACKNAKEHGLGWLEEGESLQLHSSMIEQLPAVLRVYIGCASALYGDYKNADLVKVHINSGKLTLMSFDDFDGNPIPRMLERVKIKFREQDIEYFDYVDDYEPPNLYLKSRYINEEFPRYPEQVLFEEQLDELGLLDFTGYGPSPSEFTNTIRMHRLEIDGYELIRSKALPDLDESCGQYLTFRKLIECGETLRETSIANLPKQIETFNSLFDLATKILDPVIDYFGMIKLTYGFCSSDLARKIPGGIAPKLDQHASCEINRNGNYICSRLGAAVDFIVEDENMLEVAQWIVANTPFDRLYYYGSDKPIHLSFGPESSGEVVIMRAMKNGKLMPKRIRTDLFTELNSS